MLKSSEKTVSCVERLMSMLKSSNMTVADKEGCNLSNSVLKIKRCPSLGGR